MAEITTIPEAQSSSTTFTEFNVRKDHGTPHFIRLYDNVVDRLERSQAIGKGEAFGILLGTVEEGASCTIAVEDFEPSDVVEDHILAWTPRPGSGQKVVGYYRSHGPSRFSIEDADRYLFERCFPKEARVALLVKAPKAGVGAATMYLGEDGQLETDRVTVEFPFSLQQLGAEPPSQPEPKTPVSATSRPRAGSLWKMGLTAAVAAASVIGLKGVGMFDRQAAIPMAPVVRSEVVSAPAPEPELPKSEPAPAPKKPPAEPRRPAQTGTVAKYTAPPILERAMEPVPAPVVQNFSTPPRAMRQFAPIVRDALRQSITGEIVVRVRVEVDSSGRVIAAEPLAKGRPILNALGAAAAEAVKRWEFEPARRGDQPVPGEVILSFAFRR